MPGHKLASGCSCFTVFAHQQSLCLPRQVTILWCKSCGRYLQPPKHWLKADLGGWGGGRAGLPNL